MDTPELTVPLPTAALGHAEPRRDGHEPHARDNGQHAVAPAQPRDAAAHGDVLPADLPHVGTGTVLLATGAFIALLLGLFLLGYFPHRAQLAQAAADAAALQNAAPVVNVVRPRRQTQSTDLVLPGDVQALQYTSIYPRTNGYLKRLLVDIGDHVTAGQLLAEIDTPEIDAQLEQARANAAQARVNLVKANTDLALAKLTLDRYESVIDKHAVSQQDVDDKRAQYDQTKANVDVAGAAIASSEAEVQRLVVLQGFEKVTAPFAGTITTRNYDLGALLSSTGSSTGRELFQIVRTDVLRVFVSVPQSYATTIQTGQTADLLVRNYPGRAFTGQVVRSTGAVDPATRTLRFEVDVRNTEDLLFAGMYGQVQFHVMQADAPLVVPTSALVYNADGLSVAVVSDGKVHFQKVAVARDFGNELEVAEGLTGDDRIVSNPGERLTEGLAVKTAAPSDDHKPPALAKSDVGRP